MKKLLVGLVIAALLLPGAAEATYSGFGTNAPYDSTAGVKITSEVIKSGTVKKAKKHKKKAKKVAKHHKKTHKKAHKKTHAKSKHHKKSAAHTPHKFKEHKIESQGETLPPVQVPSTEH